MTAPPAFFPTARGILHDGGTSATHRRSVEALALPSMARPDALDRTAATSLAVPLLPGPAPATGVTLNVPAAALRLDHVPSPDLAPLASPREPLSEDTRPPAKPVDTRELWGRDLTKTITFLVLHLLVGFTVAYVFTGDLAISGGIALVEPLVNAVVFFFHERAWRRTDVPLLDILTHRHTREA